MTWRIDSCLRVLQHLVLLAMVGVAWHTQGLWSAGALAGFGIAAYLTGRAEAQRTYLAALNDFTRHLNNTVECALKIAGTGSHDDHQDR